jgi:hypothetical protein
MIGNGGNIVKYWGYFLVKLAAVAGLVWALWRVLSAWAKPEPVVFQKQLIKLNPFGTDLGYTAVMLALWLLAVGLIYIVFLDQRYRCRNCLRRLRMPITYGVWDQVLMGRPRTDYICPFGHGTLRVPELHLASPDLVQWKPIDNMWKELEAIDRPKG